MAMRGTGLGKEGDGCWLLSACVNRLARFTQAKPMINKKLDPAFQSSELSRRRGREICTELAARACAPAVLVWQFAARHHWVKGVHNKGAR
jgi:hypothetical protein